MPKALARVLLLLAVPLVALGPSLLPGRRLLPLAPSALEPLAGEDPARAERAEVLANRLAADAVFPLLSDRLVLRERLLAGELPLWEERLDLGIPMLGTTLAAPFYPPGALRVLLAPEAAAAWHALVALFLAGLGMWLFLERRDLAFGACAVGAVALQASGWGLANLQLAPKLDAALWLPWMLWAVDGVLSGRRLAGIALFGASALALLAGFPPVALLGLAAAGVYAVFRATTKRAGTAALSRALALLVLGAGGAAVQLLPTWDASLHSLRGPQEADAIAAQALPLGTTLSLALPELYGAPASVVFADRDPVTWWLTRGSEAAQAEQANALEWSLFAGVAILVLAAVALASRPRHAALPAFLALTALGFVQGWPGASLLYHLPGMNLGAPSRAAAVLWVLWPWLAALGLQALLDGAPRARVATLVTALALGGAAVTFLARFDPDVWASELPTRLAARFGVDETQVAARLAMAQAGESAVRLGRALTHVVSGCAAVLLALLILARSGPGRAPRWAWTPFVAVIAVEGLLAGWSHLVPRFSQPGEALFPRSEAMAALKVAAGNGRVLRLDQSASGVDDVVALARPNLPQVYDVADLTPYTAFPRRATVELLAAVDPRSRYRTGASRLSDPRLLDHPVLDALRVTAVLARAAIDHPRLEPVLEREGFHVYRRSGALPPAWVVPAAVQTPSQATALGLLASRTVDPRRAVVLAPGVDAGPAPVPQASFEPGELTVRRPRPEELEVDVRGSSGGWLVLSESWDPGWRARVNGEGASIVRADHALRALRIPAGDSLVRLRYRPPALGLGAAASLVALLLAAWIVLRSPSAPAGALR